MSLGLVKGDLVHLLDTLYQARPNIVRDSLNPSSPITHVVDQSLTHTEI